MGQVVETCKLEITINHCKTVGNEKASASTLYCGARDLRKEANDLLPRLQPLVAFGRACKGVLSLDGGIIEVRFESSGLHEEVEDGDN